MSDQRTPTGLQSLATLRARRTFVLVINLAIYMSLLVGLWQVLAPGGWSVLRALIFVCFAIAAPWTVLGVGNSLIGLVLQHAFNDGHLEAAPFAAAAEQEAPLTTRTAILMTLRNEDAARAFARLSAMWRSLQATGQGAAFDWFVLSDTNDPAIAAAEEAAFAAWQSEVGASQSHLHYRRRTTNEGYKAGNVRAFCLTHGADFTFMLPLDADSLMDGATILAMVQIGQAHPNLGILQSLVVGAPSTSLFARIFQFGMRHGMRCYTLGAAWWTADCGPFWGHNALVRIAPFVECCDLPRLPDGAHILSHDQIEAVLMRRAGYDVRVWPQECGSYEDNPPTLLQFLQRDVRWCAGNLQYVRLLDLPGLLPISRFQIVWAISMFLGLPAWTLILVLAALMPALGDTLAPPQVAAAETLYIVFMLFNLLPKLAGLVDVALTPGGVARYSGGSKFALSAVCEIVVSWLLSAVTTLRTSLFLGGLLFGRRIGWSAQVRDTQGLSFAEAVTTLWPQTLLGVVLFGLGLTFSPFLLAWSLPLTLGYLLAVPLAVVTASPKLGIWATRVGLCAVPEDLTPAPILIDVQT